MIGKYGSWDMDTGSLRKKLSLSLSLTHTHPHKHTHTPTVNQGQTTEDHCLFDTGCHPWQINGASARKDSKHTKKTKWSKTVNQWTVNQESKADGDREKNNQSLRDHRLSFRPILKLNFKISLTAAVLLL